MNSSLMLKIAQGACVIGGVLGAIGSVISMRDKYAKIDGLCTTADNEIEVEATEIEDED